MEQYYRQQLACLCKNVRGADVAAMEASCRHWDGIAKPLGGLGLLEEMITKLSGISGTEDISLARKGVVIFCADNGVVAEGVTQTDSGVTAVVTENFARGIASVNRMASVAGADVIPVDIGVAGEIREPGVQNYKIAPGTANLRREPAMTPEQALAAVHTGIRIAGNMKDMGYDILAVGEMGIGNTTTGSAIASVMLNEAVETVTGRGAGLSEEGLQRKIQVIRDAIALHRPDPEDPLAVLAALGGLDIAGMCGLMLGGAIYRIPVVLDGMISLAAALLAQKLCPVVTDYLLASHVGREPACERGLQRLGLEPLIHGRLALGEGTGAVMLFPLLDMAESVYRQNSTFADIRIEAYERMD
ncbi:MAG: nicotinate-nucleotide--dimethylbenzimidazole phosphoribosyltransferase [Lachnospiraceae bacterium]|nr:nicotinate-nucleotide--dimethylbenzimidazole phosphoribosyltransferase [Lachnospiraceae bacterium]